MRSKCRLPLGELSLALFSPLTEPQCPAKACGGTGVPLLFPPSPALCVPRCQPSLCCTVSCPSAPRSRCWPVLPSLEVFPCARVVPWELRVFCWEPGRPTVTPGLCRDGAKRFPWLYFPTERLQEESCILPDLVLDEAIILISSKAGKCYCCAPWLVGKLRHSAGAREGPAEFKVLTVTQRLFLHPGP